MRIQQLCRVAFPSGMGLSWRADVPAGPEPAALLPRDAGRVAGVPVQAGMVVRRSSSSRLLPFPAPPSSSPKPCRQHVLPRNTHACEASPPLCRVSRTLAESPPDSLPQSPSPITSPLPPASRAGPSLSGGRGGTHPTGPVATKDPESPDPQAASHLGLSQAHAVGSRRPAPKLALFEDTIQFPRRHLRPWLLQVPEQMCHLHSAAETHVAPGRRSLSTKAVLQTQATMTMPVLVTQRENMAWTRVLPLLPGEQA